MQEKKLTSTFMAKLAKKSLPKSLTLKALPNILAATSVTKEKQAKTSFLFFYRQMWDVRMLVFVGTRDQICDLFPFSSPLTIQPTLYLQANTS